MWSDRKGALLNAKLGTSCVPFEGLAKVHAWHSCESGLAALDVFGASWPTKQTSMQLVTDLVPDVNSPDWTCLKLSHPPCETQTSQQRLIFLPFFFLCLICESILATTKKNTHFYPSLWSKDTSACWAKFPPASASLIPVATLNEKSM